MNKKELEEEALRRFPKGIKFRNHNLMPHCTGIFTSAGEVTKCFSGGIAIIANTGSSYTIYKDGKWAISEYSTSCQVSEPLIFN
jgi:hypothetical protein